MELKEALELAEAQAWPAATEELAYLHGLADATPDEVNSAEYHAVPSTSPDSNLRVENKADHEAIEAERLRGWRNHIIKDHGSLGLLGGNAVVRNVDTGALYRASVYGPDRWCDGYGKLSSYGTALQAVVLPAKVIFEGNPL